ncbi:hypothetical protein ACFL6I_22280 [candidate division KSB1 bacterium]
MTVGLISLIVGSLIAGLVFGVILQYYYDQHKVHKHKLQLRAKKKSRQKSIMDRFRVEVKNNTIRLKKEEKRIALSRQLAPIELLFKNFHKRLHKIADKELMDVLADFYKDLIDLIAKNNTYITFAEKNISQNSTLPDEAVATFYNSMTSSMLQDITKIREKGASIVTILEEKIEKS